VCLRPKAPYTAHLAPVQQATYLAVAGTCQEAACQDRPLVGASCLERPWVAHLAELLLLLLAAAAPLLLLLARGHQSLGPARLLRVEVRPLAAHHQAPA